LIQADISFRELGEAIRALTSGGFYLNGSKIADKSRELQQEDLVGGKFAVLGIGKSERKILYLKE
jgi:tyrosyl-tRNA synthetase